MPDLDRLLELLADTDSVLGLAVSSAAIVAAMVVLRLLVTTVLRRRFREDAYRRYWAAKLATYGVTALAVIGLIVLWAPLGGRLSVILGFATAGVAFAMQEVIGAFFGWINVLAGRIYTVGDRIEMGGVRGDVIDITPLRTTLLEIGSDRRGEPDGRSWVTARQPTGRMVTLSNKKTFTEPVFNYSAHLDWIWEEIAFAVPQDADWRRAERIVHEEICAHAPALRRDGEQALARLAQRYLLSKAEVEPQTFVRIAAGDVEVVGRFVTAVRTARAAKDGITRRVLERFAQDGLTVAYPSTSVSLTMPAAPAQREGV